MTTTFYFPAEKESVCITKKKIGKSSVNSFGHDLGASFI